QSILLTGLGLQSFEQTIKNCQRVYSMFSQYTLNAKLVPSPEFLGKKRIHSEGGADKYSTITVSNRFFTPVKQFAGFTIVNVNTEIDPWETLSKVDKMKWLHTEDNTIDYYILSVGEGGSNCLPTTPIVFQVGDLVEVQASLMCIPIKGSFTVKLILQSIVLLNGELTTVCQYDI
ncbi:hypothetical protein BDN71DRAFT_1403059, partial [Pleurotus eryngii]